MLDQILKDLRSSYGSLDEPHFGFVEDRYYKRPYSSLVKSLCRSFSCRETTDLNYDVCVALVLSGQHVQWALNLSLVGKYASLGRVASDGSLETISLSTEDLTADESEILAALSLYGVTTLTAELLSTVTPLSCDGDDEGKKPCTVFEAIFSQA